MSFNSVVIVSVKGNDCRTCFWYITKDEAINIMKISDSKEKSGSLTKYKNFFLLSTHKRWTIITLIIKEIKKDCKNNLKIVIIK